MEEIPTLTDGEVTLRAHRESDLDRLLEQCRDPLSIQWTVVPAPYTRDDATRFIRHAMPGGWATDEEWGFAVEYAGDFAGTVSLRNRGPGRAEIAYGAHPDVRGRGVMERALRILLDWGFSEDGRELSTVIWYANQWNWASRRLAWKVGFSFDGTLSGWLDHRGEFMDAWVGTLRRDDGLEPRSEWFDVPLIAGKKVVLRRARPSDRERLMEGGNDPLTREWIPRLPIPYDDEAADLFFASRETGMADGTAVHWVMADPVTDEFCGVMSVLRIDRPEGEIGYWTHPAARRTGMTTEAVRLAARHAFIDIADGGLGLDRLNLFAGVANTGSVAVAERAGFHRVGTQRNSAPRQVEGRPQRVDCAEFELLA